MFFQQLVRFFLCSALRKTALPALCFISLLAINFCAKAQVSAAFTTDTTKGCAPLSVHCTSTQNDGVVFWQWTTSDGQTSDETAPSFTFTKPGRYSIKLKTSDNSSADSVSLAVFANGIPTDFSYQYNNICALPVAVQFHAYDTVVNGNYHWNFGDSTVSILANPKHTYTKPGVFKVSLVTYSSEGCIDSTVNTIETGNVAVNFDAPAAACTNSEVTFISTSTSIPKSASWTIDGVEVSTSVNSFSNLFQNAGTYAIRLTEDFGGCVFSKEKTIKILTRPAAQFSESGTLQSCKYPSTVQFSNNSQNADDYEWQFGDGVTSTEANPLYEYALPGRFSPQLIAKNNNGCTDTLIKSNLILLGPPIISGIKGLPLSKCLPVEIHPAVVASVPEPIASYDWDFGDGSHATDSLPSHQYTVQGYYDVSVILQTISGCADTFVLKKAVSAGDSIVPGFTVDKTIACGSDQFLFAGTAAAKISNWQWKFGDGTYGGGQNISHRFTLTGSKTVSLTINNNGCLATVEKKDLVFVKPPIADIKVIYDCKSQLNVQLRDTSQGALTWDWDFGDGARSTDPYPPLHTYPALGMYKVFLKTTNAECSSIDSTVVSVLNTKPVFTFDPADGYLCRKDGIWLASTYPEYIADYYWDFGDGRSAFSDTAIYNYYDTAGIYYPSLVARYSNGCYDTLYSPKPVTVTGPTASFLTATPATCANDMVMFTDKSKSDGLHDIVSWHWDYGDARSETLTAPPFSHVYTNGGNYTARLIITDNNNNCTDTAYYTVKINALPAVSAGADTFACEGSAVQLMAGGAVNYLWNTDVTLSCTACAAPGASPLQNAVYTVTGTDANMCKNEDTVKVEVIHPFVMKVKEKSVEICQTKNIILQASGANLYSWNPPAGLSNANVGNTYASPLQTTTYTVTGTDVHHCFAQSEDVLVTVNPNPQFTILNNSITAQKGDINLLATTGSPDIVAWHWLPSAGLSCTDCAQPVSTAIKTITYTAIAYTDRGCTDTDRVYIHVLCNQNKIYIPQAFTPNGDGRNDWFYVMSNIDNPIISFAIYGRTGERIFMKKNTITNNPSDGWNGMQNGALLSNGTYVYVIEINCNEDKVFLKGTITLLR